METTKVTCPKCGAEFAIAEHQHTVKEAVVIGKDSNLGEIHPALAETSRNKADERIAALRDAGVDVSNLFAVQGASGEGMILRLTNGIPTVVAEDDPIFASIMSSGTIPDKRLFRRWVMSQMFHMLTYESYDKTKQGFNSALRVKGYEYQWKMVVEELRIQAKLSVNDKENFGYRNAWFNKITVTRMAEDYLAKLKKYVARLEVKRCKGIPYKRTPVGDIFVDDLETKLYAPIQRKIDDIRKADDARQLLFAVSRFNHARPKRKWETKMSSSFIDAYKGSGAFFTLQNLILFHGCRCKDDNGSFLNKPESMDLLRKRAVEYSSSRWEEGWRLFAFMKKVIEDNNLDIKAKMAEWRKK